MVALIKGSPGRPVSTQGTASTFNWNAFGFSKRSRICYSRCGLARPALLSSLPVSLCLSPAYTTLFPSLHSLFPLTRTPSNIGIGIFPSFLPILPRILWNHKDLQGAAGREASERRRRDGREWDGTGRDGMEERCLYVSCVWSIHVWDFPLSCICDCFFCVPILKMVIIHVFLILFSFTSLAMYLLSVYLFIYLSIYISIYLTHIVSLSIHCPFFHHVTFQTWKWDADVTHTLDMRSSGREQVFPS